MKTLIIKTSLTWPPNNTVPSGTIFLLIRPFMRSNVIFMTQKWLFAATLLFVTAVSNAQSVQFFDESAGASTTPISTFKLPPPWSSISSTLNAASNKNMSFAKLGVKAGTVANIQVTRRSCSPSSAPPTKLQPFRRLIQSYESMA